MIILVRSMKNKSGPCSAMQLASSNLWSICQKRLLVGNNMEEWFGLAYMARWPMAKANTTQYCRNHDNRGKKCQSWLTQHFNCESGMHIIRRIHSSCIAYLEAGQRFYFSVAASEKKKNIEQFRLKQGPMDNWFKSISIYYLRLSNYRSLCSKHI